MQALITGGTGFIGTSLCQRLDKAGYKITVLTRQPEKLKNSNYRAIKSLNEITNTEQIDLVVNLAGAPIDRNWSDAYKKVLFDSRINTTNALIKLFQNLQQKPKFFISGSAIGFYDPATCFTHQLCEAWENAALFANEIQIPTCIIRLGVVLGKDGGALKKMLPSFKFGLGGKIGSGKQMFSWVHKQDVIRAIEFLIDKKLTGSYNLTAPNPVTNKEFTQSLAKTLKKPAVFTIPAIMIKFLFKEMGQELLLRGNKIEPTELLSAGFEFNYADIDSALENILQG